MDSADGFLACPECGRNMVLRSSKFGKFYGCSGYPNCKVTHGAHSDGRPLGRPANYETRQWRIKAHKVFDVLWKGPDAVMDRSEAYVWMQKTLALSEEEAHIGNFGISVCQRLIKAVEVRDQIAEING